MPEIPTFTARIVVETGPNCPSLIRRAARQAGYRHNTEWLRDRIARALAAELEGVTYEQVMDKMPLSWAESPGCVKLTTQADKPVV